jgi:DoxX-like family
MQLTGRVITALAVLFFVFDGVTKVFNVPQVREASAQLGYRDSLSIYIGLTLLACTSLYVIPRTAVLGAILLTGYLGGAVASQLRIGAPIFNISFAVIFGGMVWAGLYLRESRLRVLIPLRSN